MDKDTEKYITDIIVPKIQEGKVALFLGAGFSIGTPTLSGSTIPSTSELIERICEEAKLPEDERSEIDLKDAFSIGEDEIDDFENFLQKNFLTGTPFDWQIEFFQHRWRIIFTTNIDTTPRESINILRKKDKNKCPDYQSFHYRDRAPVIRTPIQPSLVFLHGMVERASEGLVFDSAAYADTTVRPGDWFPEAASHISFGNCLFIGSKFKETDLDAALKNKSMWTNDEVQRDNWIVLDKFKASDLKIYKKRGIIPITATAEEFSGFVNSKLKPLTHKKFIKILLPHISFSTSQSIAASWFASAFEHVPTQIDANKSRRGLFSRFYFGDTPEWFYIANDVPAPFEHTEKIVSAITSAGQSDILNHVIAVTGPVCSGKTTACMMALKSISVANTSVYSYSSYDGVNIDYLWKVIKDTKGTFVIYFDNASEHYYAINDIIKRSTALRSTRRLIFLVETRTKDFLYNKRHFSNTPEDSIRVIETPILSMSDAEAFIDKLSVFGIRFEKLQGLSRPEAINLIVDYERGYRGDMLATVCDLATVEPYKNKLDAEFTSINDPLAVEIFRLLSLVTAAKHSLPISYLCEICQHSTVKILDCIARHLEGNVRSKGDSLYLSLRHSVIALYHLENSFDANDLVDSIVKMMSVLHGKFTLAEIRLHPLPYRIYRDILSCHFLFEHAFKNDNAESYIGDVYSRCQTYFSDDGIFWLQYGRYYDKIGKIDDALHCLRMGLAIFPSFQTRHALGHVLLKKYIDNNLIDETLFEDGVMHLEFELDTRGKNDPYPATTLIDMLVKILKINFTDHVYEKARQIVNKHVHHISNPLFNEVVFKFIEVGRTYGKHFAL